MNFKKLSTYLGKALVVLSFVFVFFLISSLDLSSAIKLFKPSWIVMIIVLSFIFSLMYYPMAKAYMLLLELVSSKKLDIIVISTYLKTVVMKYAPGNVFHFLGRHSLVEKANLDHKDIAFANASEIILQLLAVSVFFAIGIFYFGFSLDIDGYIKLSKSNLALALGLFFILIFIVVFSKKYRDIFFNYNSFITILKVLSLHILFILSQALTLISVYVLFFDLEYNFLTLVHTIFIASIAWFLGFVVPGAPGGIGIRESVLVLLLPSVIPLSKELILAGALVYRLITILGEALTYLLAKLVKKRDIYER